MSQYYSLTNLITSRIKAGKSAGQREVTKFPSTTTSLFFVDESGAVELLDWQALKKFQIKPSI